MQYQLAIKLFLNYFFVNTLFQSNNYDYKAQLNRELFFLEITKNKLGYSLPIPNHNHYIFTFDLIKV